MDLSLPPQAQAALTEHLPALRGRLLDGGDARPDAEALEVVAREKGSGVLVVTVRARADQGHPGTPTVATLELHPHTQGGEMGYTSTEIDFSSADY